MDYAIFIAWMAFCICLLLLQRARMIRGARRTVSDWAAREGYRVVACEPAPCWHPRSSGLSWRTVLHVCVEDGSGVQRWAWIRTSTLSDAVKVSWEERE